MEKEQKHLAIASVPVQTWGDLYDEEQALERGTIFADLDKAFFVTEKDRKVSSTRASALEPEEEMRLSIQKVSFMLDDIRLFLDMHPEDPEGLDLLKELSGKRKKLLKEFALQFYPLTADCMADIYKEYPDTDSYVWKLGPAPWEGACV